MKNFRVFIYISLPLIVLAWIGYLALHQARDVQRDVASLQNLYYRFKNTDPIKAKESLELILRQEPNHMDSVYELGNWYLEQGDTRGGLNFLQHQEQRHPNDPHIARLFTKFYQVIGQSDMAAFYSKKALALEEGQSSTIPPNQVVQTEEGTAALSFIPPVKTQALFDLSPLLRHAIGQMQSDPAQAKAQLETIIALKPDSEEAYSSLGYLALQAGQKQAAERYFSKAYSLRESTSLAVQLAYLLIEAKRFDQAARYLDYAFLHGNAKTRSQVQLIRDYLKRAQEPAALSQLAAVPVSPRVRALNAFYQYKTQAPEKALYYINWLLEHFPQDEQIQKEAAYFFVATHNNQRALTLWQAIYARSDSPHDALIIAYLLDGMGQTKNAYAYFLRASKSKDAKDNLAANQALTNLAGIQNKILPEPYFLEAYSAPFYFSRFDLGVFPYILRLGRTLDERHHTALYLNNRRTKDNRSGSTSLIFPGVISQIFEDNVAIYSLGIRTNPFAEQPLMAFLEVGRAQSLNPTNTPIWRDDVRGGLVYFNAWGEPSEYAPKLEFPFKYVSTLYADAIYYSRYDNNIIGTAWFRPGLRIGRYQTASLDLYLANYLILDKNREFYNNTYVLGPGVSFMPNNRYNVIFRLESLQGYYIPVNSPTPNPYKSHYYNNVAMLELFYRF